MKNLAPMLLVALLMASCAAGIPKPPRELLQPCNEPTPAVATNGALAEYTLALRSSLRGCNDDKAALREWADTLEKQ